MPKIAYINRTRFEATSRAVINDANAICAEYYQQGYVLTVRQVFYQFVARGLLLNTMKNYKRLVSILNDARMAGAMDWKFLEDRTRFIRRESSWDNPEGMIAAAASSYHRNRWEGQEFYAEVWIEKDALIGVVERPCKALDLPHFSTRGYGSQSELWRAGRRLGDIVNDGRQVRVFHLGDHDPSGVDMTRDIEERLNLFVATDTGVDDAVVVERLALNMDQIRQYDPPPNPAKLSDSRALGYIEKYGHSSWELDALAPGVFDELIRDAVNPLIDWDIWDAGISRENKEQATLDATFEHWGAVVRLLDILDDDPNYEPGEPTSYEWRADLD